jgi:uncharacterized protein YkwD
MRPPTLLRIVTAVMVAPAGCDAPFRGGEFPTGPEVPAVAAPEAVLAELVAGHRASVGCAPITWMPPVAAAAAKHAADMATEGWWGHTGPGGESIVTYLQDQGVSASVAGDALARNFTGPEAPMRVFQGWLDSLPHAAILGDCRFRAHGVGHAEGYWVWYGVG